MFGSAPRHGDQTGTPRNSSQDNTEFFLEKLRSLENRLTRQIACPHGNIIFADTYLRSDNGRVFQKMCEDCGLKMETSDYKAKVKHEYESAKAEYERVFGTDATATD